MAGGETGSPGRPGPADCRGERGSGTGETLVMGRCTRGERVDRKRKRRGILKRTALVLILIVLVAMPVLATESRVDGLGGIGLYITDDTNVFIFPGLLSQYRNQVVGELGTTATANADRTAGVNYYFADQGFDLGMYFNRGVSGVSDVAYTNITLDRMHMLMVGLGNLGFGIALGSDGFSDDQAAAGALKSESVRLIELLGGYSTDQFDVGGRVDINSGKQEVEGVSNNVEESGFGFIVNARSTIDFGSNATLVPVVTFGTGSNSVSNPAGPDTKDDYSGTGFGVGVGLSTMIDDMNMLVLAVEPFGYNSNKLKSDDGAGTTTESTVGTLVLPAFYAAVESQVNDWLTARIGVGQVFKKVSTKTDVGGTTTVESAQSFSDFGMAFGVGLHFGQFDLDGRFNESFLYGGPNFVSGATNNLLTRISLKYTW